MALEEVALPIQGVNYSYPLDKQSGATTFYMLNVRPFDTLERRIRLGQRPGMDKLYAQQIGGTASPVVWVGSVTVVN